MRTKVIIAGPRTFNDFDFLEEKALEILSDFNLEQIEIVSGTARGADRLGERLAIKHNLYLKYYPADWNLYGKSAGYIRNEEMAKYADICIVFWDGKSKGSKHMIDIAKKYKLKLFIIRY